VAVVVTVDAVGLDDVVTTVVVVAAAAGMLQVDMVHADDFERMGRSTVSFL